MEWIKISPETELPIGKRVVLYEAYSFISYGKVGTVTDKNKVTEDDLNKELLVYYGSPFTHYALFIEPKA